MRRHPYDYDDRMWAGVRSVGRAVPEVLALALFVCAIAVWAPALAKWWSGA